MRQVFQISIHDQGELPADAMASYPAGRVAPKPLGERLRVTGVSQGPMAASGLTPGAGQYTSQSTMIEVGHQVGGYTILQLIGKGGMGEVYLGQHRRVARRAAIKVLIPELSHRAAIVDRFFSEARATSLIRHSGIVEVIDCDVHEDQAYIIMELLEGESLGEYMHRTGPLSGDLGLAVGVGVNVARAVGAAHELEQVTIVHRDLKPDNVFLHLPSADGSVVVKVLDFGIAKLAEQGVASNTSTGVLMGTPSYMSPEQCRGARAVDARSDIYSLGCILYETMAGAAPFVREGVGDLIIAHVSEQPVPLTSLVRGLPPQLDDVITRMMAKRPDDRIQSMAEVAESLLAVASSLGLQVGEHLRPQKPVQKPAEIAKALANTTPMPGGKSTPGTGPHRILAGQGSGPLPGAPQRPPSLPKDPATPYALSDRDANPSGPPVVMAGRTQVMPVVAPEPTPVPVARRPAKEPTTLGNAAREVSRAPSDGGKKRWPLVLGVGGAAAAALVVVMATQGGKPTKRGAGATGADEAPSAQPSAAEPPAVPPTAAEPAAATAPRDPETVSIMLSGVPPGSTVLLDGNSSAIPLRVARGPQRHKVVVRAPTGAERTLDVDGSESRTLDVGPMGGAAPKAGREPAREAKLRAEPEREAKPRVEITREVKPRPEAAAAAAVPAAQEPTKSRTETSRSTSSSRVRERASAASAVEAPAAPAKKPAKGAAAMEAITDI